MSAFNENAVLVPKGIGHVNQFVFEFILSQNVTSSDTVVVTLPAGVSKDMVPVDSKAYALSSNIYTMDADWAPSAITHNRTTGKTTFTPGGNVAAGTKIVALYTAIS